jgi:hypothetical protein
LEQLRCTPYSEPLCRLVARVTMKACTRDEDEKPEILPSLLRQGKIPALSLLNG